MVLSDTSRSMEYLVIGTDKKRGSVSSRIATVFKDLWDPQDRTVLGRTTVSWAKILAFYTVFFTSLIGFWCVAWFMFDLSVDDNYPRYNHASVYFSKSYQSLQSGADKPPSPDIDNKIGLILPNPGMGFRPVPEYQSTLVRFVQGRPSSYKRYTDHIQAYVDMYENEKQEGENFIDCDKLQLSESRDKTKVCRFNVDVLGDGCTWQKDYGYDDGQPCILLKLNKVYGWEPIPYKNEEDVPDNLKDRFSPYHIGVTCEGEGPLDHENMGPIEFWPKQGFPILYYPYLNQEGYKAPVVFLKFLRPSNGVVINIWCKAWARNIKHHREDRTGSIHFELLVD